MQLWHSFGTETHLWHLYIICATFAQFGTEIHVVEFVLYLCFSVQLLHKFGTEIHL